MTMQMPDVLRWQGQTHDIVSGLDPIAIYPEVAKTNFMSIDTTCWRGYEATWIIGDDDYLRLKHIDGVINSVPNNNNIGEHEFEPADQIYSIFPTYDCPIATLSFTGEFTVGSGEWRSENVYFVTYPNYHTISVAEGKVTNVRVQDRDGWLKDRGIVLKDLRCVGFYLHN